MHAWHMDTSGDDWNVLASLLPARWQQAAVEFGAVERLRGFSSPEALLRTILLHVALGYSLRETVVRARLAGWADVSDVALLKRMRNSEGWLRFLCIALLREGGAAVFGTKVGRVRIVDGTIVKEPGKTGSQWRILYSLRLPSLMCDFLEVTASDGAGNGESLNRLAVARHELILADAGYCSVAGIEYVQRRGADVLVRINPQAFVAYTPQGKRFALLTRLLALSQAGQIGEWEVVLHGPNASFRGRVCAVRKGEHAIELANRRLHRRASKKQMSTKPETLEFAKHVIVFTTRYRESAAKILEWYRMRWQIELVFKRLKSLAKLGHLPKHDDRSSRAWLHGKLLVALLTQKLIGIGRNISPSGCTLSVSTATEPVARVQLRPPSSPARY
jgi:Transposase DDE domain